MKIRGTTQHFSIQALQICDAFLIWLGFVIASFVHGPIRELLGMPSIGDDGFKGTVWIIFIVVPLTPLVLERFGFYDRLLSRHRFQSSSILLRAMLAVVLITTLIAVFGKYSDTRRLVLGSGLLFSSGFLWVRSHLTTKFLRSRAASEGYLERVVLAGAPRETGLFLEDLESEILEAWKIVAHFDLET
jgi:FlaA1/EpsC-like NDP-sugar epimerase